MIYSRKERGELETLVLAPYGLKSAASRGRVYPEKEAKTRTAFERDRDRIIHTTAFRRLEYKTQVFVYYEGVHTFTLSQNSIQSLVTHFLERCLLAGL